MKKIKDIAREHGLDRKAFESFCFSAKRFRVTGAMVDSLDDENIELAVKLFNMTPREREKYYQMEEEKAAASVQEQIEAKAQFQQEQKQYREELSQMLITSGFSFDGYTIKKYSGYISGDDAVEIPRSLGWFSSDNGQKLTDALVKIRRNAIMELKEAAYDLGCNAVIGVDFDYITLDPQTKQFLTGNTVYEPYIICVTANGNAVVIEKDE